MRLTDLTFYLALTSALAMLGGCGVKPAHLAPPPGTQKNSYPRVYPDPSTDPQPIRPQQ